MSWENYIKRHPDFNLSDDKIINHSKKGDYKPKHSLYKYERIHYESVVNCVISMQKHEEKLMKEIIPNELIGDTCIIPLNDLKQSLEYVKKAILIMCEFPKTKKGEVFQAKLNKILRQLKY